MRSDTLSALGSFVTFRRLLLFLTGLAGLFFLIQAARFLPVTGDNVHPEAANMMIAQQWAFGTLPYTNFRQPPYLLAAFPPLWYGALAVAARAGLADLDALTLFGRVLALLSLGGVLALTYQWHRRAGRPVEQALLAPAFFLSFPILMPWAISARPDLPGLLVTLLALLLAGTGHRSRSVVLAGLASAGAVLTKQSLLALPFAVGLWLVASRRWKSLTAFILAWAVPLGLTVLILDWSTDGLLQLNLAGAQFGTFGVANVLHLLQRLLTAQGESYTITLLAFGVLGLAGAWRQEGPARLLAFYGLTASVLAMAGSGLAGANVNHYLEPAAAAALLVPYGLDLLRRDWDRGRRLAVFVTILLLLLLLPSLNLRRWSAFNSQPDDLRSLVPFVAHRRVLTDIPYLGARSATPELLDPVPLAYLEKAGRWSPEPVARDLHALKYDVVILGRALDVPGHDTARYPTLGPVLRAAIAENYGLCDHIGPATLYGPLVAGPAGRRPRCPESTRHSSAASMPATLAGTDDPPLPPR